MTGRAVTGRDVIPCAPCAQAGALAARCPQAPSSRPDSDAFAAKGSALAATTAELRS